MSIQPPDIRAHSPRIPGCKTAFGRALFGRKAPLARGPRIRSACKEVVEALEQRQLLSTTGDGFTASFYGAQYTSVAAFPAPNINSGDYSTHVDVINTTNGTQAIAPADAPTGFNPNAGTNGPGFNFSGVFKTNVVVQQSGYFTFYPTTDDGAQINLDGAVAGAANLTAARGPTQDTDAAPSQWVAGSTHNVQFYYNNGGGGWAYELRWSESSGAAGSGTSLIPFSLMTGSGAPGVANLEAPTPIVAPPVPTMAASTTNSITLSWSSHDIDAASYIVERSTSAAGTYTPLNASSPVPSADGGTNTYLDAGLTRGTTYYYKLVSNSIYGLATVGVGSELTSAATAGFTTPNTNSALASPPVAVVPGAGGNVLTIGQVANATTYNILRSSTLTGTYSQVGSVPYSSSASTVTYTDAANNANSFYEIQAVDTAVATSDPGYSTTSGAATLNHGDGFGASYYTGDFNGGATFSATTVFQPSTLASAPTFSTIIPAINSGGQGVGNRPTYTPAGFNSAQAAGQGGIFSTEFDFSIVAPYSEQITFLPRSDDGVQLTVDGAIIDHQGSRGATTDTAVVPVAWVAGSTHTVQMAYYQGTGGWEADLGWTSPSLAALNPGGYYGANGAAVPGFEANALGIATAAKPTTPVIADAPVLTVSTFSATMVGLSFTASEGDSYNVYRGTSAGGEGATPIATVAGSPGASPGVSAYTYADSTVTTGTKYYYLVKPVNSSGVGTTSNEVSVTPLLIAPTAPTNVTGVPGAVFPTALTLGGSASAASSIIVSWASSPNANNYDVLRAPVTGGVAGAFTTIATGVTAATYTDSTAAINAQYEYEVVARNAANPTGASPGSTSAPSPIVHTDQGVVEEFYANNTNLGGAGNASGSSTQITAAPGNPNASSEQPAINFTDSNPADLPPGGTQGTNYSTLFTGKVNITQAGNYTFYSNTDDQGILYVDGALIAVGTSATGNTNNNTTVLNLNPGRYDFQMFQSQEGGGQRFEFLYSGPDTSNATVIVPQTALAPLTGAPLAATNLQTSVGTVNPAGSTYPVTVTFSDIADNELGYQLQRSTDAAFDGNGGVVTVATTGLVSNGSPQAGGAPGAGAGTITDPAAPAGKTSYYRVVALNFEGSAPSGAQAATTPAGGKVAGVEVNFFNNQWWRSTNQNTTAIVSGGVGSATSTGALVSDEQTVLPNINGTGVDTGTGTLEANGNGSKFPDPAGTIGPDNFSAVFTGQVAITTAGTYNFMANTDDDGYLFVDDKLASAYPGGHGNNNGDVSYPLTLSAGPHDFQFFMSNGGGGWAFQMYYSGPDSGNATVIVPSTALSTIGRPAVAPTTFVATPTSGNPSQVTLTWSNNNTSAIRYVIQRSTDPTFSTNVTTFNAGLNGAAANVTSYPATSTYTDSGLVFGTTYYYQIFAQNYDGTSAAATATVVIPNNYPSVNSVTAVQDVNGNIQVSFPAETYSGINGYQLLRSVNNGAYVAVAGSPFYSATATQYTYQDNAAGLAAGSSYSYEVITQGATSGNSAPAVSNALYYVTTPASGGTTINHSAGFTGQTDLTLTGNGIFTPVVTATGQLKLTSPAANEATGTYETSSLSINSDFATSFDFQFTNPTPPGADGFAFVIQGQGVSAVGGVGGGLGYTGVAPSVAVYFNMYNNVTQTGLGINGNLQNTIDMSGTLGNAFNSTGTGNATDVFQVSLTYQASTQTLFEAIRDTTNGKGYSTSYNLSSYGLVASTLLGPGSVDYVGFSASTGGSFSQQTINDWVLNDVSSTRTAQQPQSVSASEQVSGDIQVSFPAPGTGGLAGVTYQLLKSVNGGAYTNIGSPIPATSTSVYTYLDTGPFTIGSTYTYEAIVSGSAPPSPATSNPVAYVDSSTLVNSVTSYHNDAASTGQNLTESVLTPASVSSKTGFGKLFSTAVDGQIYAQPLIKPGVNITTGNNQGTHTVAYVATENDSLYAIDSTSGQVLWQDSFLTPEAALTAGGATVAVSTISSGDVNTGDITPQIGITSTPVIDPATGYLYLVAATKQIVNGNTASKHFVQVLYKVNIASGATTSTVIGDTTVNTSGAVTYNSGPYVLDPNGQGDGVINTTVNGTNQNVVYFNALTENSRSGLALHNGSIYIAFASHGDNGPYHGWVLGYNVNSLAATAVLNTNPNGGLDGIWQGGGTLTFDPQGYMYFETGNGTFDTTLNAQGFPIFGDYGDSVVKVAIDSTSTQNNQNINGWGLKVADYFTPTNQAALSSADEDLGSGGTLILPDSVGSAAHPHLMLAAGKEGKVYLIDRDTMGHFSTTTDNVVQEMAGGVGGAGSYGTPAFYNDGTTNWIYWGGKNDNGRAYKISSGVMTTPVTYVTATSFGLLGATPSVSANSTNNGIVWYIDGGTNQLFAYSASNLSTQLYNSGANSTRDALGTAVKFTTPTIAGGEVFVESSNALVVYGLFVPPTAAPPIPSNLIATPASNTQINLSWSESVVSGASPTGFNIDESADAGKTWTQVGTAAAGAASYPVTGLQPGTTYDFKIDAFNSIGTSAFSNIGSATTTNLAASVNLPSGFAGAASQLQLNGSAKINGSNLELTDGNNGEAGSAFTKGTVSVNGFNTSFNFRLSNVNADGFTFTLQNATTGNTSVGGGGAGLGYQNIGNSVCVKFDFYDNAGEGTDSTGLFVNGDLPTVPGGATPAEASVDMSSSGVVLNSGDPMLVNLSYNGVTLSEQVTDTSTNAVFTTSYAINIPSILGSALGFVGFTAGTGGASAIQNIQSWTYTPTAGIPYAPTNFTVSPASGTELDLSWVDSLSSVTTYNVMELQNGAYTQIAQVAGTATGYPVTGLTSGGSYSFEVVAVNSAGSSPPAGPITGTTPVAPVDVTNFVASNITTSRVTLNWANDPSNATGIVITRQLESDSSQYVTTLAPTITTYTDSTLLPGRAYAYTIAAKNLAGPSPGLELMIQSIPAAPTGLTATAGPAQVTLNWTASGHAVSSYNIYRGTSPGGEGATPIATGVTQASFTDTSATGLVVGQLYYYTITAVDTGGESVASTEVSATPLAVTAPSLVGSPVINGDNPNGLLNAAGQPASGVQRSMVEDVVYTFSSAVTIPNASSAFTVVGAGAHPGTVPPNLTATAVAGSNGTQWVVTLTGGAAGVLGSIANGEYGITINPNAVFAAADGTTQLAAGRTDQFYRLFGDINGDQTINAADNGQLKRALTIYNPAFDSNADGAVNAADNGQFKNDLAVNYVGDGFTPSI